jgi:hypothetical protein
LQTTLLKNVKVKATNHMNEDSILANFNLIWEQQMVWLIESTFQFSGQSNFLNERAPLGMQASRSKAVKRPNGSHKATNGGWGQLELSKMASNFTRADSNSSLISDNCKYECLFLCMCV